MLSQVSDSKRVKKGEVIRLHPLPEETRTELHRTEAEEQAARIRAVYLDKKPMPKTTKDIVGKADDVRAHILAASLFPNIYNRKSLLEHA